jgi:hypothetical protein
VRETTQMRKISTLLMAATMLLVLSAPSALSAQGGMSMQKLDSPREDRGVRTGGFRIVPEVFFETRYDGNYFRESDKDANGAVPVTIFRVMPALEVSNRGNRIVKVHFKGVGDVRYYLSDDKYSEAFDGQSILGAKGSGRVLLFPGSVFQLFVQDRFERSPRPQNVASSETFTRLYNVLGAGVIFEPFSDAMTFKLAYDYARDIFEDNDKGNSAEHSVGLSAKWKFFPKTQVFFDARGSMHEYDEATIASDSTPVRASTGLNGFLTKRVFFLLGGGYGTTLHKEGASYSNYLANAMVGYVLTDMLTIQTAYSRDVMQSLFGNYAKNDAIQLGAQLRLYGMFDINTDVSYNFLGYGESAEPDGYNYVGGSPRTDQKLVGKISVAMNLLKYVGVNVGALFENNTTDFKIVAEDGSSTDYGDYSKYEIFANVVVRY